MSEYFEIITLQFNHKPELIPQTVKGLIATIQSRNLAKDLPAQKALRIGWILTELLTNAVKHVKMPSSTISIHESSAGFIIQKADYGDPLPYFPTDKRADFANPVVIYHNGPELLTGHISENKIKFVVEDTGAPLTDDLSQISEHLGLLIISKACDSFQYEYIAAERKNIFSCTLSLK